MFRLTKEEQWIVAFLAGALVLGAAVREWRARHPKIAGLATLEIRGH
jgi:hypothetical protein